MKSHCSHATPEVNEHAVHCKAGSEIAVPGAHTVNFYIIDWPHHLFFDESVAHIAQTVALAGVSPELPVEWIFFVWTNTLCRAEKMECQKQDRQ